MVGWVRPARRKLSSNLVILILIVYLVILILIGYFNISEK